MGVTLSQISGGTKEIVIPLECGEDLHIEFYPGQVNEKTFAHVLRFQAMDAKDMEPAMTGINESLARLIASWDVVEDDGVTPMSHDAEHLAGLPMMTRIEIMSKCVEGMRLGGKNGTPLKQPSGATSLRGKKASSSRR